WMKENIYLAAIDAGTTGERTIIFDEKGRVVTWMYLEHPSYFLKPTWVEQEAAEWWNRICETSKAALKEAAEKGVNPDMIVGISVTNQRETIVPVDADLEPLRRAIVWQDRRTVSQCNWIKENLGENTVYKITGLTVDPYFSAPKIMWIKEHEPNIYKETHKFLLVHDYIIAKLTDVPITSWDNASRTMLFDIGKLDWSDNLLDGIGINEEKMPEPYPSGKIVGEVTRKAAEETSFAEGTPVVCGGGDQQCAAIGVGVVRRGRIKATTGTGTFILSFLDKPSFDPKMRVLCSCHGIPGKWVQEASIFSTGTIYRWFRDEFGHLEKATTELVRTDPYEMLNKEAAAAPPGSKGVLVIPHFAGAGAPHWNAYARGVIVGLAIGHSRKNIVRAILEGIALEIRKNIEVMRELGVHIEEMRVTGGATKNPHFNQIQADVYGLPVMRGRVEESTALGCAILAGVGTGVFKSVEEATNRMVHIVERYEPRLENKATYDKLFKIHRKIYDALEKAGVYKDLAEFDM
ncbi:MAG: FGGY family carbohydrate kinase, partial [Candidatus Bathyarchaeota archaeon]|nr:FGGY family carbohydrate kinase [Candidatus Bathyarchaeota archaeon]